jgi:hypothetical protein
VPTTRHVPREIRDRHGPGGRVELEALEESLVVLGDRLVLRRAIAPDAPGIEPSPERSHARSSRGPGSSLGAPAGVALRGIAERWNQMRICLLEPGKVRIDAGRRHVRATAADLGMAHARSRRPILEWDVIEELCLNGGYFRTSRFGNANATKKLISRVSHKLRERIGIRSSPFYRYRSDCGWRSRFEARDGLPED